MRRFLALGALAALCFAVPAWAINTAWVRDPVMWRTTGVNDSSSFSIGAGPGKVEYTVPMDTKNFAAPPDLPPSTNAATSDTVLWISFSLASVQPQPSGITAASDSLYIAPQVSWDGATWISVSPTLTFSAAAGADGVPTPLIVLPYGGSSAPQYFVNLRQLYSAGNGFPFNGVTASTNAAPSFHSMTKFPLIRFAVQPSTGTTGQFFATIGHWTNTTNYPKLTRERVSLRCTDNTAVQGYRDSSTFNVASTVARADTTAPVYLSPYVPWLSTGPVSAPGNTDTVAFIMFDQIPNPGTSQTFPTTIDTSYAKMQLSMNGTNWIDVKNGSGTGNWVASTERSISAATYTAAGTNAFWWTFGVPVGGPNALTPQVEPNGPITAGLLTRSCIFGPWTMCRLIIQNSGREGGEFQVRVHGYKVVP